MKTTNNKSQHILSRRHHSNELLELLRLRRPFRVGRGQHLPQLGLCAGNSLLCSCELTARVLKSRTQLFCLPLCR